MKKALVTGASSGLGRHISIKLAQKKIKVIGLARSQKKLANLKKIIGNKYFDYFVVDLKKLNELEKISINILKKEKFIDILINNAGIYKKSDLLNFEINEINDLIDTNLKAPIILTRLFSKTMKRKKKGWIINISSIAGKIPIENSSVYCASKFGLYGFTSSLNKELKNYGITVCTISPGGIDTPLWKKIKYPGDIRRALQPNDIFKIIELILNFGINVNFSEAVLLPRIESF